MGGGHELSLGVCRELGMQDFFSQDNAFDF